MSKDTTAAATEKTIVRTGIYKINAERKIMCAPPAFWDVEATIDVYFSDGTCETQYMVISDFDFRCMQINNKSMEELMKSDEEDDDFCKGIQGLLRDVVREGGDFGKGVGGFL